MMPIEWNCTVHSLSEARASAAQHTNWGLDQWNTRVIDLSRRLVIKISLEKQKTCSVKCTVKIVFGFQDDLSFSRLVLKTKRPVLKTKGYIVLIVLENMSLVFKTTCAV